MNSRPLGPELKDFRFVSFWNFEFLLILCGFSAIIFLEVGATFCNFVDSFVDFVDTVVDYKEG